MSSLEGPFLFQKGNFAKILLLIDHGQPPFPFRPLALAVSLSEQGN